MDYNTQREKLPLPEYGRSIQNMVNMAINLPNKEERQQCANTIVSIMGNMFPHLRDVPEFNHKLWDHLAIMANYKLDIDYPYEVTPKKELNRKPQRVPYIQKGIRYRQYGRYIEQLTGKLEEMNDSPERDELIYLVANQMKKSLLNWNRDAATDERVADDLERYTHHAVQLSQYNYELVTLQEMQNPPQGKTVKRNKRKK